MHLQIIAETLDIEIKRWAAGKEGNMRALLSSLQNVCFTMYNAVYNLQTSSALVHHRFLYSSLDDMFNSDGRVKDVFTRKMKVLEGLMACIEKSFLFQENYYFHLAGCIVVF